ncbi:hypothetical protein SERLADRAFT_444129 [Serpula lacrymans var. lacrymans S7.9]|uniref:Uncharacterized protein n=1 Tax=Serpula lacrymans var. lacrymans (strain S7.9) TaxID=578457 RepID=F8PEL1_SERL9|nr:uncharacterized protein SERLADRAFT_444129 [Serpula lacrymans var. lacrymans S7.9]EGO18462.1 hypothetical protein SERLADRAFT_444129 [Serpula lacrymans var. lacrymans S7.9]
MPTSDSLGSNGSSYGSSTHCACNDPGDKFLLSDNNGTCECGQRMQDTASTISSAYMVPLTNRPPSVAIAQAVFSARHSLEAHSPEILLSPCACSLRPDSSSPLSDPNPVEHLDVPPYKESSLQRGDILNLTTTCTCSGVFTSVKQAHITLDSMSFEAIISGSTVRGHSLVPTQARVRSYLHRDRFAEHLDNLLLAVAKEREDAAVHSQESVGYQNSEDESDQSSDEHDIYSQDIAHNDSQGSIKPFPKQNLIKSTKCAVLQDFPSDLFGDEPDTRSSSTESGRSSNTVAADCISIANLPPRSTHPSLVLRCDFGVLEQQRNMMLGAREGIQQYKDTGLAGEQKQSKRHASIQNFSSWPSDTTLEKRPPIKRFVPSVGSALGSPNRRRDPDTLRVKRRADEISDGLSIDMKTRTSTKWPKLDMNMRIAGSQTEYLAIEPASLRRAASLRSQNSFYSDEEDAQANKVDSIFSISIFS